MRDAEINDAITKLYSKVDMYSAEDWWYFDIPLAIWLHKQSLSCCWCHVNARILVDKSDQHAMSGQWSQPVLYSLPSVRAVQNLVLEWIGSIWQYFQTNLLNLLSSSMPGPAVEK
jgi:hypothetical protein